MIYYLITSAVVLAEQVAKRWAKAVCRGKHGKEYGEEKNVRETPNGRVRIELLENPGAAAGIGADHPKLLAGLSGFLLGGFVYELRKEREKGITAAGIGYALLLGGGLSNLLSRLREGSVTDYIRFPKLPVKWLSRLVFNVSDFAIFLGSFLIFLRKNINLTEDAE